MNFCTSIYSRHLPPQSTHKRRQQRYLEAKRVHFRFQQATENVLQAFEDTSDTSSTNGKLISLFSYKKTVISFIEMYYNYK